ncbi:MAG: hypothetical protein HQK83_02230 [Fibrobacteria bacterium]|nr:hypothetical protein [Fibrobacteria bacterium]
MVFAIMIVLFSISLSDAQKLEIGGYGENETMFTFADTGYFSDVAKLRVEASAGTDFYSFESHVIFSTAYQPIDPILGMRKGSKMMSLFDGMFENMLAGVQNDTTLSAMMTDSSNAGAMDGFSELMFMLDDRTIRYLPYTSFYPKETIMLDRLLIKLFFKHADVYVGRQQIAWGTGYAFNPTDIWNQKNPLDVSAPKLGVNALRIEMPFGELSNINLIGVPGADLKHSSVGVRVKTNMLGYDASVSASRFMNADRVILGLPARNIFGVDMAGQIGEVGVWAEAVAINHKNDDMDNFEIDSTYFQVDAGLDYTFESGIYVMGEYYFNSLGHSNPDRYAPTDIFLQYMGDMAGLGENYLMLGVRDNFWDKVDATVFVLSNLSDYSAIIMPTAEYYFSDGVSLDFRVSIAAGDRKKTEFGSIYHSMMAKIVAYF